MKNMKWIILVSCYFATAAFAGTSASLAVKCTGYTPHLQGNYYGEYQIFMKTIPFSSASRADLLRTSEGYTIGLYKDAKVTYKNSKKKDVDSIERIAFSSGSNEKLEMTFDTSAPCLATDLGSLHWTFSGRLVDTSSGSSVTTDLVCNSTYSPDFYSPEQLCKENPRKPRIPAAPTL